LSELPHLSRHGHPQRPDWQSIVVVGTERAQVLHPRNEFSRSDRHEAVPQHYLTIGLLDLCRPFETWITLIPKREATSSSELNTAVALDNDQAVFLQALQGGSYRRS
jgi:hypothetical protein